MASREKRLGLVPEQRIITRRRPARNRELAAIQDTKLKSEFGEELLSSSLVAAIKQQNPTNFGAMTQPSPPPPVRPSQISAGLAAVTTSQRSTCLLCSDPVFISIEDAKSKAAKERIAMTKTLCFQMNMTSKEIPKHCTAEMFPFCTVCQRRVVQLYENEKIIHEAQRKISKNIAVIERTVADAEILRATMKMAGEEKKFVKLRDKILDGYRTKLMIKQKVRESMVLGKEMPMQRPICSPTFILEKSPVRRKTPTSKPNTSQQREADDNVTANVSPMDTGTEPGSSSASEDQQKDNQEQTVETGNEGATVTGLPRRSVQFQLPQPQQKQQQSSVQNAIKKSINTSTWIASTSAAQGIVGKYNENSCSMVISDVRTRSNSASPAPPTPPVVIKQEPVDTLSPAPGPAGKRKRRSLFQGIEILRVTDLQTNKIYLQCSICRCKVAVTGYSTGLSPFQTMTTHITEKHLGKKRRAALLAAATSQILPSKRQFSCKICPKVFETRKGLVEHNQDHLRPKKVVPPVSSPPIPVTNSISHPSYIQDLECDICGRPIKGNQSNLLAHKFSHKNNDERLIAMAAGEKGSRPALLRPEQKRRRAAPTFSVKKVRKGKSKIINTSSGRKAKVFGDRSLDSGPFKCQVCYRSFPRNCHLALHMRGHARRSMMPVPPSRRSQTSVSGKTRSSKPISNEKDQPQLEQEQHEPTSTDEFPSSQEQGDFENQEEKNQEDSPSKSDQLESGQLDDQMETDEVEDKTKNISSSELAMSDTTTSEPSAS